MQWGRIIGTGLVGLLWAQAATAGMLKEGISAFERNDYGRATELLERFSREFKTDPRPYYYLAKCYEQRFEISKVDESLRLYRQYSADRLQALRQMQVKEGPEFYRKMLADDAEDVSARMLLLVSLLIEKNYSEAEQVVAELPAHRVPEGLGDVYQVVVGTLHLAKDELEPAQKAFKEAWRIQPDNRYAYERVQEVDRRLKAREAEQSVTEAPTERGFEFSFKVGRDLMAEANYEGAVEALTQAVSLDPGHAEARKALATAKRKFSEQLFERGTGYAKEKQFGAALEAFSQALIQDPTNKKALAALQEAKAKMDSSPSP